MDRKGHIGGGMNAEISSIAALKYRARHSAWQVRVLDD